MVVAGVGTYLVARWQSARDSPQRHLIQLPVAPFLLFLLPIQESLYSDCPDCRKSNVFYRSSDLEDSRPLDSYTGTERSLLYLRVCMYVRMYVCMYLCTYVCMYVFTYVRPYSAYICMC